MAESSSAGESLTIGSPETWTSQGMNVVSAFPNPITATYQCSICGKWWGRKRFEVVCLVLHLPRTCCHHGQVEVKPPEVLDA